MPPGSATLAGDEGAAITGAVDMPFAIPNVRVEKPAVVVHTWIGWLRSVSNIPHAFAIQSFVGEFAAAAGRDAGLWGRAIS